MVRDVSKEESEGQDQRVTCKSKSGGLGGPVGTVSERDAERSIDDERGLERGGVWGRSRVRPERKAVTTQRIDSGEGPRVNGAIKP